MNHRNALPVDGLDESLWDSPSKPEDTSKQAHLTKPTYQEQRERDESLRQELESVRQVNEAIQGVTLSLRKAKDNMKTVNNTVSAASALLNTWTRILSQTEHNQRLILDPSWQGASQDIANIEEEALQKQRAIERREAEEEERKIAAARRADEEEKRKTEAVVKPTKAGASRGTSRAPSAGRGSVAHTPSSSYVQMGGTSSSGIRRGTSSTRRTTSGIGRGTAGRGTKGRG
ncbi:putative DASH complex subunit Duo1 [Cladophialophora carrionii]|uniref:DASH complex subunit DUO1 n=1 Tax=Cladophialophora carrionii TaxID=86049 RepID=A0A1C1CKS9_9EURO|nr:putative DASH complex subunit Duo1 [Cladophialophora carrionii]